MTENQRLSDTGLTLAERTRLVGILGRLESPFDGERAAAALLAARMLRERGLSWDTLIALPAAPRVPPRAARPADNLAFCRRHAWHLAPWPAAFVESLSHIRTPWTPGQIAKLAEIARDLHARGFA